MKSLLIYITIVTCSMIIFATIGYGILTYSANLYFCLITPLMFCMFLLSIIKTAEKWQNKTFFSCFAESFSAIAFGYLWYLGCAALNKIEQGFTPWKAGPPEYWYVLVMILAGVFIAFMMIFAGRFLKRRKPKYVLFGGDREIF